MTTHMPSFASPQSTPHSTDNDQRVSDIQRERTISYLQSAYADGRLDTSELDRRIGIALAAHTRADLNQAFSGVDAPATSRPAAQLGLPVPYVTHHPVKRSRAAAAFAHGSGLFSSIIGPGIVYAASTPGSVTRREAAKAFNFQLVALPIGFLTGIMAGWFDADFISGAWAVVWFALTMIGAIKAHNGEDWTNPVMRHVPFRVLDEGRPTR